MEERVNWYGVQSLLSGYIHYVDTDCLMEFADDNKMLLRMKYGI